MIVVTAVISWNFPTHTGNIAGAACVVAILQGWNKMLGDMEGGSKTVELEMSREVEVGKRERK